MIYNKSFLKKEFKESYFEHSISVKKRLEYAIFLALISFGVHFLLLTLSRSVLLDVVPKYMNPSYYSVISAYIDISYIFYVIYLATNYKLLTFAEIKSNKWYILMKFGFSPLQMIFTKLYARLITAFIVYGTGYLITLFLTSFLKYPLVLEYILPLFILGLLDIFFIITVTMTSSIYLKKGILSDYVMAISVIFLVVLKFFLQYYTTINDRSKFDSLQVLAYFSEYIVILTSIIFACIIIIFIRAKINAKYYYFSFYMKDLDFSDNIKIIMNAGTKAKKKKIREYDVKTKTRIVSRLLNVLLTILISIFILFNIIVLLISLSTQRQEISLFKVIPYVFKSETMQPEIMYNDLAFFKYIHLGEPLNRDDIVLYQAHEEVNIARIQLFQAEKIVVDIDNYPPQDENYVYKEALNRNQIYGKYIGRSRWLGVLILFANTTFGRLFLLLIPSILLFYYKPIIEFIRYVTNEGLKEQ